MRAATSQFLTVGQLLALALVDPTSAQTSTFGNSTSNATLNLIASQEAKHAYGGSPFVAPVIATGTGSWAHAYEQARALVAQMTNEEKENATIGYASTTNGCSGNSGAVRRLGFPGMCLNDAGNGVRGTDGTSGFASGVHVGAAWNRNMAYNRAHYMGKEFAGKGVNVALGPVAGPVGKIALGGRNWEGFSNDPYLAGQLTYESVRGLQENVIACIKHFGAYEQETNRFPTADGLNTSISSNVDDKTIHELYNWGFMDALRAGAGSAMCSYNGVNGSFACQNSKMLNGILKSELGFEGFVVSDWGAQHTGVASANAGLDMAMPNSVYWSGNLTRAVNNGSMTAARLDDMVTRIVAAWYKFAPFEHSGHGMPVNLTLPHTVTSVIDPASKDTIFQGAVEGHVLVKNVKNALPLKSPKVLSLFGYDAYAPLFNDVPSGPFGLWNFGYQPVNANASILLPVLLGAVDPGVGSAHEGTLITGGGSGATEPAYINAPYDAFQQQAYEDSTFLLWDFQSQDPVVDAGSDACIVFINEFASEGFDRPSLADPYSDVLVNNVAASCNNTIVVIHNAGIRTVDAFIENPNITAVIFAHLPGQDSGRSLVEVMYGKQSPSGRLPYTLAKKASDYGSLLAPTVASATSDYYTEDNFTEGVYIDYKAFIAQNITPRYEFGYGLTYTTFSYSNMRSNVYSNVSLASTPPNATVVEGGNPTLYDVIATVDVSVKNTGSVTAAEVAQLYIGIPTAPPKQLRGFSKQGVKPGMTVNFHFELTRRDLSVWDVVTQQWALQKGRYSVYVGKSVLDIQLTGALTI